MFRQVQKVHNEVQLRVCLKIREEVFIQEQAVDRDIEIDAHDVLEDTSCTHFLLIVNGMPIGTARTLIKDGSIKIQRFAILTKERKGGHGSYFIQEIERISNAQHFILSAQEHAIPFYEKNGYSIVSDTYLEANIKHKDMEKRL
jgi:predicted GNAT family N-acyltransferase